MDYMASGLRYTPKTVSECHFNLSYIRLLFFFFYNTDIKYIDLNFLHPKVK